jgi:uncharacterized protein YndB with AHSA1/START domain
MEVWLEAKPGGRCVERGVRNGQPYELDGIVTVYEPPHQLVMLLNSQPGDPDEAALMRIAITLEETAGETLVRVVHEVQLLQQSESSGQIAELPIAPVVVGPRAIYNQLPPHPGLGPGVDVTTSRLPATASLSATGQGLSNELAARWTMRLGELQALIRTNPAIER